jgi:hypothetical protein
LWNAAAEDELEAELVIGLAFLWIGKDLICLRNLLELLDGFRVVLVLVGVVL